MPKYVGLFNWTETGVKNVSATVERYRQATGMIESMGGKIESIHWTMGPYDIVTVVEAPDDETVSAIVLKLAAQGNLEVTTMRAFTADEMAGIIGKIG
jgi:uncharacterized protein with GYD domain